MSRIPQQGLRENWQQFTLLVIINAFVGGMVGMERSILPQLAEADFGIVARTATLSFIVVFGVTKAVTNYFTGVLSNRLGRKKLLIIGWLFGLPVPFLLIYAPDWSWVIFANVLLGINQGLAWSSTVIMKIDLVGEKDRGFAMGLNESAGYLAVGIGAFITGWLASSYGLRPYPFYLGVGLSVLGLFSSLFLVRDTSHFIKQESKTTHQKQLKNPFWQTTWKDKNLGSITQAGMINNLNDGMIWGLFPILLISQGFNLEQTAILVAVYPTVWGMGQLITGKLADIYRKKNLLFWGMFVQSLAILAFTLTNGYNAYVLLLSLIGIGTAVVYPTFLAAIADHTHPEQRPQSIGIFRLWRDLGYAIGAILSGVIADFFGIAYSIGLVGVITFLSAIIIQIRMDKSSIGA